MQLRLIIAFCLAVAITAQFDNSFDYLQQGKDWESLLCHNETYRGKVVQQSPIDIDTKAAKPWTSLRYWFPLYRPTPATVNFYNVSCVITPNSNDNLGFGMVYGMQSDRNKNEEITTNITIHSPSTLR